MSPLQAASQAGDTERVQQLLDGGAPVEEKDAYGYTALMWASSKLQGPHGGGEAAARQGRFGVIGREGRVRQDRADASEYQGGHTDAMNGRCSTRWWCCCLRRACRWMRRSTTLHGNTEVLILPTL